MVLAPFAYHFLSDGAITCRNKQVRAESPPSSWLRTLPVNGSLEKLEGMMGLNDASPWSCDLPAVSASAGKQHKARRMIPTPSPSPQGLII
jgi:hypothetical protein